MTNAEIIKSVAEKVMGWFWSGEWRAWVVASEVDADGRLTNCFPDGLDMLHDSLGEYAGEEPFNPLHNANHTLLVVERMREMGWGVQVMNYFEHTSKWYAIFYHQVTGENDGRANDESFGTAVCLAALKLLEEK